MAPKAKRPTPHLYSKQEGIELTAHNLDEILFKLIGSELTDIERAPDTRSLIRVVLSPLKDLSIETPQLTKGPR